MKTLVNPERRGGKALSSAKNPLVEDPVPNGIFCSGEAE